MKKRIVFSLLIFCIFTGTLCAQNPGSQPVQTVSPREIYVGDTAEISYTFYSPVAFPMGNADSVNLLFSEKFSQTEDYTVTKGTLSRTGNQYRLSFLFTPWRTGLIKIPSFDLLTLMNSASPGFAVDLSPVMVASILEKTGKSTLQPSSPPILIPGTTYIVCAAGILILLLIILVIRILLNFQGLLSFCSKIIRYFGYGRNSRNALRAVRRLEKSVSKIDDAAFCTVLEHTLRKYLAYRFDESFYSLTSNLIEPFFYEMTAGTMPLSVSLYVETLCTLFCRLDYIRFAQNSIDSMRLPASKYAAALDVAERLQIVQHARDVILGFEKSVQEKNQEE